MSEYIIGKEGEGRKSEFLGKIGGLVVWTRSESDIIRWTKPELAVQNAKELGICCYVIENYGQIQQRVLRSITVTQPMLSVGVLDSLCQLRELFQCYQDAKESIEATGSAEWWLEKFVKTVDKLLE